MSHRFHIERHTMKWSSRTTHNHKKGYGLREDGQCSNCETDEDLPRYWKSGEVPCQDCECIIDDVEGYGGTAFCKCSNRGGK